MSPDRASGARLQVLALLAYPLGISPGQRFRIEQWHPYLADEGIDVTFLPFASRQLTALVHSPGRYSEKAIRMSFALARRLRDAWRARSFDAVFISREASLIGPALAERLAKRRRPAMVFDLDDAVWVRYSSPTNRFFSYLKFPGKTRSLCRMASVVLAGNEHLAAYAGRFNRDVRIVPTTVSLKAYGPGPKREDQRLPVIGWTGSHSSAQYLEMVSGALRRLRQRREFRLVVVGAEGISVPGVETECRPWRPETEVRDIQSFDIGIMPLPDEAWTRGKCALKAIQCMGVGMPAVVSPVGVNAQVVEDGRNGFLAATEDEWVDALDRLLANPELRERMGTAALATVRREYSAEVQAPRVAEAIRTICGSPSSDPEAAPP